MTPVLILPLFSFLVLPIGWLEYRMLPKSRLAGILAFVNLIVLYCPWIIAIWHSHICYTCIIFRLLGLCMIATALALWKTAAPLILRVPGQLRAMPEKIVTEGPFRHTRHPLYVGHVLFISGGLLIFGALKIFMETPLVWGIAAIAALYEENTRLKPHFGETFQKYKSKTPFLLPLWGWILLAFIYIGVIVQLFISVFQ